MQEMKPGNQDDEMQVVYLERLRCRCGFKVQYRYLSRGRREMGLTVAVFELFIV
jgi:hypothetical protein